MGGRCEPGFQHLGTDRAPQVYTTVWKSAVTPIETHVLAPKVVEAGTFAARTLAGERHGYERKIFHDAIGPEDSVRYVVWPLVDRWSVVRIGGWSAQRGGLPRTVEPE